jgi:catechol 2,3-dioxygenase-like lactoylglutathione lyase family enzyme
MLDHISLGVKDLTRAGKFYDAALAALGYRRLSDGATALGYGKTAAQLWLLAAARPVKPDAESGLHVCFVAARRAEVDAFHQAALSQGGRDNGKPGLRADYGDNYYAAFVIDPDGYRLEAYCAAAG